MDLRLVCVKSLVAQVETELNFFKSISLKRDIFFVKVYKLF